MEVFLELDKNRFQSRTESYYKYFTPFVDQMKDIIQKHPDVAENHVFNDYINIVQWPIRKLEYSYILDTIINKFKKDAVVLDAGCGVTPVPFLLGTYFNNVHAIDYSAEDISLMKNVKEKNNFPGSGNVTFDRQNICQMSFLDDTFDCISCVSVLEHIDFPYYIDAISELYRILKPGGTLVCTMDFWLGASRVQTVNSGGFTQQDIHQISEMFGNQIDLSGVEILEDIKKQDIDAFWSTYYDEKLNFEIREYIAVGFTITKSLDQDMVKHTIQKLTQYKHEQAYTALLSRNQIITAIEQDRKERLNIINKQTVEIATLKKDRSIHLSDIDTLTKEINRLSEEKNSLYVHLDERLNVINTQKLELDILSKDHAARYEVIENQKLTINELEQSNRKLEEEYQCLINKFSSSLILRFLVKLKIIDLKKQS